MQLAARGLRKMDAKAERIGDPAEVAALRRQANKVRLEAIGTATLLTALSLLLP